MPDIDGIHVERAGRGTPVLCLHGIGSSSASFADLLRLLEDAHDVISWDAPGYARSADPAGPPGMDGFADAAVVVLDALGLPTAHVVGVSFGGVVAVRTALRHPDRIRSLVLADSTPGSGVSDDSAVRMRQRGDQLDADGPVAFAAARAPRLLSPSAPPELVARVARTMAASIRNPGYRWAAEAMAATDHRDDLANLRPPTLVICGEQDQVCPPAVSDEMAASIPGARRITLPGAGHLANQEAPHAFARAVTRFVAQVDEPATAPTQP